MTGVTEGLFPGPGRGRAPAAAWPAAFCASCPALRLAGCDSLARCRGTWPAGGCRTGGGPCHRGRYHASRRLRCGAAALPGQRARHAQPGRHPRRTCSTPSWPRGALYRYRRQGQTGGRLTWLLLAGTVPGVIAGSVIRVHLLPGPATFDLVISAFLTPLGAWLLRRPEPAAPRTIRLPTATLIPLAAIVGCAGGIYGIGGGSILAPMLTAAGRAIPTSSGSPHAASGRTAPAAVAHQPAAPPLTGPDLLADERPQQHSALPLKLSHPRSVAGGWLRSDDTGQGERTRGESV